MNYYYPLDETWTKEEVIDVVHFFTLIERAYEQKVKRNELLEAYKQFKRVIPSKREEKQLFTQFKRGSQYASYPVVKKASEKSDKYIQM